MCVKPTFVLVFMGLAVLTTGGTQSFSSADGDSQLDEVMDEMSSEQLDALIDQLEKNYASKSREKKRLIDDDVSSDPLPSPPQNQNTPVTSEPNCKRWAIC